MRNLSLYCKSDVPSAYEILKSGAVALFIALPQQSWAQHSHRHLLTSSTTHCSYLPSGKPSYCFYIISPISKVHTYPFIMGSSHSRTAQKTRANLDTASTVSEKTAQPRTSHMPGPDPTREGAQPTQTNPDDVNEFMTLNANAEDTNARYTNQYQVPGATVIESNPTFSQPERKVADSGPKLASRFNHTHTILFGPKDSSSRGQACRDITGTGEKPPVWISKKVAKSFKKSNLLLICSLSSVTDTVIQTGK